MFITTDARDVSTVLNALQITRYLFVQPGFKVLHLIANKFHNKHCQLVNDLRSFQI